MSNCAIILAGGEGKRMKSDKPKTLSPVLGKPMLLWVISALKNAGIDDICVVKGFKKECVEEFLGTLDFPVQSVFQAERLGTGHAVMMAKDFLAAHDGNVVILNGDAPFMTGDTIRKSLAQHTETGCAATVISAKVDDPTTTPQERSTRSTPAATGSTARCCSACSAESRATTRRANIICPTRSRCCSPTENPSALTPPNAATRCSEPTIPLSSRS